MRPARFALRPDPCKTRTRAPAATGVRLCAAVLLHFLHYFFIAFSALFLAPLFPLYEKRQGSMPWRVAPQVRLELTTLRLTAECSAIELLRIIRGLWRDSFGCPAVCCQLPPLYAWLWRTPRLRTSLLARAPPWLLPRLRGSLASPGFRSPPRSPLCFGSGKNFRSSRSSWIPATSYSPKPFPAQYHQRLEA